MEAQPVKGMTVNYHCLDSEKHLIPDEDGILPAIITKVYPSSSMSAVDLTVFTNQPSSILVRRTSIAMGLTNGGGWTFRMSKVKAGG